MYRRGRSCSWREDEARELGTRLALGELTGRVLACSFGRPAERRSGAAQAERRAAKQGALAAEARDNRRGEGAEPKLW